MERKIRYTITNEFHNKTIEQFLKAKEYPHQAIVQLKRTHEGILKNGIWAYVNEKLTVGDTLSLHLVEEETESSIQPVFVPLDIVYEDEDLLVINKPANMPIHPSMNHYEGTLANGLLYYFSQQGKSFTFRCINRLDRDTSGLTIIAKHLLSAGILSRQVSKREIKRTYRAICQGKIPDSGTIDAPIARVHDSTIERCVNFSTGEHAITHYKRIAYDSQKDLSLVELRLETGRTHQIRVHMKHIGHPIIGDFLYNPDFRYCNRQALHSYSLSFTHPLLEETPVASTPTESFSENAGSLSSAKKEMHFASPFPEDLKCIFQDF